MRRILAVLALANAGLCLIGSAPVRAADVRLSLPHYDCAAAQANHAPVRRLGQFTGGVYREWREYLSAAANGVPICVQTLVPESGFLTRSEAEAYLSAGLPQASAPGSSAPMTQEANPLDQTINVPAAPLQRPRRRGSEKQSSIGGTSTEMAAVANDSRTIVGDSTVFPYSNVVYLVSQYPTGDAFRCSGVLATPYVVMTAGHCVHNRTDGGYASRITIVPGQYQAGGAPVRPYGQITASGAATTVEWQTLSGPDNQLITDYRHDVATVRLAAPVSGITSFMPVIYDNPTASVTSVGYPAQVGSSAATNYAQWTAGGGMTANAVKGNFQHIGLNEYQIAVSGGNSGGPYWITDSLGRQMLVGITSYGDDTTGASGGPYYGAFNQALVANWLRWTPSTPVADPVATANLTFANAIAIGGETGHMAGSNAGAVAETGGPLPAKVGGGRIAWWRWTAPRDGQVTIDTLGSDFDTVLGVYVGSALGQLTTVAENDDVQDGIVQQSRVQFTAKAGTVYSIAVDGFNGPAPNDGGDMGDIVLNWTMAPPGYALATIPISGESGEGFAANSTLNPDPAAPIIAGTGGGRVLYFLWKAPRTGYVAFDTQGSNFDTVLGAFTGVSKPTLFAIAQNDDISATIVQSRVFFLANGGTNYVIAVDGKAAAKGNVALNWAMTPALYPDTGWWYQSSLPGAGMALEASPDPVNGGGRIFFAAYEYDSAGHPIWYSSDLSPAAASANASGAWIYRGDLRQVHLDSTGALSTINLGSLQLDVPGANALGLTWPAQIGGQHVALARYPIAGSTVAPPAVGIAIQTGWWFNPAQPGSGWLIEVQGTNLFLGYFTFRSDGTPIWYSASGPTDGKSFSASLLETSNGPNFTQPASGPIGMTTRGTIKLLFSAPNQTQVTLPDGTVQALQRYTNF